MPTLLKLRIITFDGTVFIEKFSITTDGNRSNVASKVYVAWILFTFLLSEGWNFGTASTTVVFLFLQIDKEPLSLLATYSCSVTDSAHGLRLKAEEHYANVCATHESVV